MPLLLDASIAACWAFDDEDHSVAALALERVHTDAALVPSLWWFEARNTFIVSERRGRLTESDTATFLHGFAHLRVTVDRSPQETDGLSPARNPGLTIYDAAYLELRDRIRRFNHSGSAKLAEFRAQAWIQAFRFDH
jgi:predicted nucleic acid-binding protein